MERRRPDVMLRHDPSSHDHLAHEPNRHDGCEQQHEAKSDEAVRRADGIGNPSKPRHAGHGRGHRSCAERGEHAPHAVRYRVPTRHHKSCSLKDKIGKDPSRHRTNVPDLKGVLSTYGGNTSPAETTVVSGACPQMLRSGLYRFGSSCPRKARHRD